MFLFFIFFRTGGFEFEIYSLFNTIFFSGWISHNFFSIFCCGFQFQFDSLWGIRAEIIEWKIQFICILFELFDTTFFNFVFFIGIIFFWGFFLVSLEGFYRWRGLGMAVWLFYISIFFLASGWLLMLEKFW